VSDIFLSYNREDQATAQRFAEALQAEGFEVWWDTTLRAGDAYDEVTENALNEAKAVVVLWSPRSVVSRWVRAEATQADRNGTLVPVTIEACKRPIMFELTQTADLSHWRGGAGDTAWQAFLADVRRLVGEPAAPPVPKSAAPVSERPSICVLPFENMSGDPEHGYLADGIVESITAALSRVRQFFVIARASAFAYKGKAANVCDIGRQLGVAYVLEGSVQTAGARIRISVQLVETEGGANVWTGRHDGTLDDIFDLQDRISEQVAGELQPSIRVAEIERSRRKRPQDLGAYDYAMRALPHVWVLEEEGSAKALELLGKALEIDPDYPLALSLAAWCHAQRSVYTWAADVDESQALALTLAERAVELSGDDPLVLAVLGAVHTFTHNLGTARVLLERALAIDPNAAWTWSRLGWIDVYSDRPKEAIEKFERALRLSPLDPMNFNNYAGIGAAYEVEGDHQRAADLGRRALEERPHARWLYRHLAASLAGAGQMEEAQQAYAEMLRVYPDLTAAQFRRAMPFTPAVVERMTNNLRKLGLPD
jgi:adenylate cyclase